MSTRNKIMIGVVVGLFVVVIALLAYLIPNHLMTLGTDEHPEGPSFLDGAPQWAREDFPLVVRSVEHATDEPVESSAVREAVERINGRLDFDAFVYDNARPVDVMVTLRAPSEPGDLDPGGDAVLRVADSSGDPPHRATLCMVRQSNTGGAGDLTTLVIQHELGHCLGLAHDCTATSIMCGGECCTLSPTPDRTIPRWISDHDRASLRARYGADGE